MCCIQQPFSQSFVNDADKSCIKASTFLNFIVWQSKGKELICFYVFLNYALCFGVGESKISLQAKLSLIRPWIWYQCTYVYERNVYSHKYVYPKVPSYLNLFTSSSCSHSETRCKGVHQQYWIINLKYNIRMLYIL